MTTLPLEAAACPTCHTSGSFLILTRSADGTDLVCGDCK